jgi:hypothetical protein
MNVFNRARDDLGGFIDDDSLGVMFDYDFTK